MLDSPSYTNAEDLFPGNPRGTFEFKRRRGRAYAPLEYYNKELLRALYISELLEISARALDSFAQTPETAGNNDLDFSPKSPRASRALDTLGTLGERTRARTLDAPNSVTALVRDSKSPDTARTPDRALVTQRLLKEKILGKSYLRAQLLEKKAE